MANTGRMEKACFFFLEGGSGWYNLERIYKTSNPEVTVPGLAGKVQFNLCHAFTPSGCDGSKNAIGYIIDGNNCTPLTTSGSYKPTQWVYTAEEPVKQLKNTMIKGIKMLNDKFLGMAQHRKYNVQLKDGVQIENFSKNL